MRHAFAPAHVSGLFAVHDEAPELQRKGSRGAGWSLARGARASATNGAATQVRVQGQSAPAPVTRDALRRLLPGRHLHVDLRLDLPVGQGFGMSAAGTLAACLAAAALADLDPEEALRATHEAEVTAGTGLGDAVGSWFGSGELRSRPGCPPDGWAMRIEPPADTEFLLCVAGPGIPTPAIIRDAAWKQRTRALADPAVDRILAAGRPEAWGRILAESTAFTLALGLLPEALRQAGAALPEDVAWGQCMLGTSLWATGPAGMLDIAAKQLAKMGHVLRVPVDPNGARLVR
ncbi:MAG: pantoate kinase [Thermoplasmata archaeon]|nr:pantoate kinase [Thermoplasmata archaeon]